MCDPGFLQRGSLRRIFIVPDLVACDWIGYGSVGCGRFCLTFLQDDWALAPDAVFHELGHNLGLSHSASVGDEYGDCSCAM